MGSRRDRESNGFYMNAYRQYDRRRRTLFLYYTPDTIRVVL